jgi:hypothetical protein
MDEGPIVGLGGREYFAQDYDRFRICHQFKQFAAAPDDFAFAF